MLINNFDSLESAENASGAPWFQVVRPEDVDTIPDVILDQISTAITLAGGATAYNMKATVGTVDWEESTEDVGGRDIHNARITFVIPKDRADVLNYARELNNKGVIAIVRDANDQRRLMGSIEEPAVFRRVTRTTGKFGGAERNQHLYEIVYSGRNPVPFYQVTAHLPAPANVCPAHPSLSVAVDDATPDFGDSIAVTATPSDITPTAYDFFLPQNDGNHKRVTQASPTYNWTVDFVGTGTIYVGCNDGTDSGYTLTGVSVTATGYLLDALVCQPEIACAYRVLSTAYASAAIINVRRSSGSPSTADFTYDEIINGTLETWVGGGNDGFVTARYDQTGKGRDQFQGTAAYQPRIVDSGTLVVDVNGNPTAKTTSEANGMECYGFGTSNDGTIYTTMHASGGNLSSRYGTIFGRTANPAIGRFDDAGTDTNATAIDSGSPTTKVNGAAISPEQRGALGTALVGNDCIVTITGIDWSANLATWAATKVEHLEYCDIDTLQGDFIGFNANGTDQQAYIETEMNAFYGYY